MELKRICKRAFDRNKITYILLFIIALYSYRNIRPFLHMTEKITIPELCLSYYNEAFWVGLLIPVYLYIQEKIMYIFDDTKILLRFSNFKEWWKAKVKTIFYFDFMIVIFINLLLCLYMIKIRPVFSVEGVLVLITAVLQQITVLLALGLILQLMMMVKYNFYPNFVILTVLTIASERLDYMFNIDMSKYYSVSRLSTVKYLFDEYGNFISGSKILYLFGSIAVVFLLYEIGFNRLRKNDVLWR